MKRYLKYIFLTLILGIMTLSCVEEMDAPHQIVESESLTLVPRVKSFTNQYVTKANYEGNETKITRIAVLFFDNSQKLVHIETENDENGITSVTLNKSMLNDRDMSSSTVVVIANMDLANVKKADGTTLQSNKSSLTVEGLNDYSFHFEESQTVITDLSSEFSGFPMIGTATGLNLSSSIDHTDALPVNLQILYAKINFSISVAEGTENQNLVSPSFALTGYSVHNVSKVTSYVQPTGATASDDYAYKTTGCSGTASGNADLNGATVGFTFYVAESRYAHNSELKGIYPDDSWLTSTYYDDLKQQYKPKIATVSTGTPGTGLATYVTVNGTYKDYRGTDWNVNYKVYLGKDNTENFEVDRNSEYTNVLTIKGIRNNDSYGTGDVWIDHRVNVSATSDNAKYATITRETLVDAHFEVRPLRVKLPTSIDRVLLYLPKYPEYNNTQITETETGVNENWIAIENNNGRVKDITQYSSNGKRKYFTTSLIKQLYLENNDEKYGIRTNSISGDPRNGQKYIQLFDGDCAWIYIDENVNGGEREAIIELVFYDKEGNALSDVEAFMIKQQGLHTTSSGFQIENYEEYLHTYDSQDLYTNPLTDYTQQGYKWGLEGENLSKDQNVVLSGKTPSTSYYYDFFHTKDRENSNAIGSLGTYEVLPEGIIEHNHGLNFTNNAGISNEMTIIDMNTRPSSAIQYCLSKNKFEVDESADEKHKMDVHWYLPDVYEMTQILNEGKNTFSDFSEYTYWSSQPAWTTTLLGINYLIEDTDNARAISIEAATADNYTGTPVPRTNQHRIRCAYSAEGVKDVDFSGTRAPEGIGAMRFYMRAWKDWNTKEKGYFNWDGSLKQKKIPNTTYYTLPETYAFPKSASDANGDFGKYLEGYGFEFDPSDEENWSPEYNISYPKLNRWPGLTQKKVILRDVTILGQTLTAYTLEGTKQETMGTDTTFLAEYGGNDITAGGLESLDHLHGGSDLSIAFAKGTDATHSPYFQYKKIEKVVSSTKTRTWQVPKYTAKENVNESTDYTLGESGYDYSSADNAKKAGEDKVKSSYSNYTTAYVETDSQWQIIRTRYKYIIKYKDYKKYYSYNSGGNWIETDNGTTTTTNTADPTDQLVMYGGNSFTIKANNDNEISSVKIYFSGSNVVDERGNGHDYLRFTKDGFTGSSDQNPPGMTYSGDGDKGTMTWSGDPQYELTFKLVLLRKTYDNYGIWGDPKSFQYLSNNADSKEESIVIDQIDVRYKKETTTGQ